MLRRIVCIVVFVVGIGVNMSACSFVDTIAHRITHACPELVVLGAVNVILAGYCWWLRCCNKKLQRKMVEGESVKPILTDASDEAKLQELEKELACVEEKNELSTRLAHAMEDPIPEESKKGHDVDAQTQTEEYWPSGAIESPSVLKSELAAIESRLEKIVAEYQGLLQSRATQIKDLGQQLQKREQTIRRLKLFIVLYHYIKKKGFQSTLR